MSALPRRARGSRGARGKGRGASSRRGGGRNFSSLEEMMERNKIREELEDEESDGSSADEKDKGAEDGKTNEKKLDAEILKQSDDDEDDEEASSEDEDASRKPRRAGGVGGLIEVENPNRMKQDTAETGVKLTRKEREALDAQKRERQLDRMRREGRGFQAQKDLERIEVARQKRQEAEQKRREELKEKEERRLAGRGGDPSLR